MTRISCLHFMIFHSSALKDRSNKRRRGPGHWSVDLQEKEISPSQLSIGGQRVGANIYLHTANVYTISKAVALGNRNESSSQFDQFAHLLYKTSLPLLVASLLIVLTMSLNGSSITFVSSLLIYNLSEQQSQLVIFRKRN